MYSSRAHPESELSELVFLIEEKLFADDVASNPNPGGGGCWLTFVFRWLLTLERLDALLLEGETFLLVELIEPSLIL